jgi:hypothetical protein
MKALHEIFLSLLMVAFWVFVISTLPGPRMHAGTGASNTSRDHQSQVCGQFSLGSHGPRSQPSGLLVPQRQQPCMDLAANH